MSSQDKRTGGMPDGMGQAWVFDGVNGSGVRISARSASGNLILEEFYGFILLEGVDDGSFGIADE